MSSPGLRKLGFRAIIFILFIYLTKIYHFSYYLVIVIVLNSGSTTIPQYSSGWAAWYHR